MARMKPRPTERDKAGYRRGVPQHEPRCSNCAHGSNEYRTGTQTQYDMRCRLLMCFVKTHGTCNRHEPKPNT